MSAPSGVVEPRATRREWIGLAVLALPTLLLSLDRNMFPHPTQMAQASK